MKNVCVMNVMMYVVCAGRTHRWVTVKINHFIDLHQLSIHPPSPRCPPLCIFQIRIGPLWFLIRNDPKLGQGPTLEGWCVLLCFIKPILGNRYVWSRGFIVSEPRETHPRSEITDVPTLPCPPLDNLGCPDPHPPH